MDQSVQQYGPAMEKFYYGMMQNGGRQQGDQLIHDMTQRGEMQDEQTRAQMMSSGLPLGSTAMARGMSGQLSQNALNRNLAIGQLEQDLMNQAMARQFQGAQGLQGAQQYYGGPSSVELAMLGARTPYDMGNLQARVQNQANMDQMMQALGTYQPERMAGPSQFEQIWGPLINAGGSAAMAAILGSDHRLKKDIVYVDDPIFEDKVGCSRVIFKWKENDEIGAGVIAQDLQEVHPELVHERDDGYLAVDYQGVFNLAFG